MEHTVFDVTQIKYGDYQSDGKKQHPQNYPVWLTEEKIMQLVRKKEAKRRS